jgi:hypothetical protein|tara:strand:+ start:122 stop:691 length:570 start_codon:yes stop_codon:yes gene_type:complete
MALLVMSVFGVTGCGSDDDVDRESRVENAAPEASGVSGALSEAALTTPDCNSLVMLVLFDLISVTNFFSTDIQEFFDSNNIRKVRDFRDYLELDDDLRIIGEEEINSYSSSDASALMDKLDRLDRFNYVGFDLLDLVNSIYIESHNNRFDDAYRAVLCRLDSDLRALLGRCDVASSRTAALEGGDVDES